MQKNNAPFFVSASIFYHNYRLFVNFLENIRSISAYCTNRSTGCDGDRPKRLSQTGEAGRNALSFFAPDMYAGNRENIKAGRNLQIPSGIAEVFYFATTLKMRLGT